MMWNTDNYDHVYITEINFKKKYLRDYDASSSKKSTNPITIHWAVDASVPADGSPGPGWPLPVAETVAH